MSGVIGELATAVVAVSGSTQATVQELLTGR